MKNEQQILSPEERQHIRAEMMFRDEVRRELKLIEPPARQEPSWRRRVEPFLDMMSKPVVLTIIFGLAASLITTSLQQRAAGRDKEQAYLQTLQDRKFQLLSSFDAGFNKSFSSQIWYSEKSKWVNKYSDHPEAFPGGLAEYNKMIDDLEAKWKDLSALPTSEGLFAQVEALFDSPAVHRKLQALREAEKVTGADHNTLERQVRPKVADLLLAMGHEIKGTAHAPG